ncbi:MAG: transcription elongation factor GreA [Calditrichia bacterium]
MSDFIHISREGYEKLKAELEELKGVKRPELSKKIAEARDFGDLKENAEYHAAREALSLLETKISKMEETIRRAKIISKKDLTDDHVAIYTQVKLYDEIRKIERTYTLVSQEESNLQEGKISVASPVGKALMGRKVGEVVEIKVPAGLLKYKILEIKLSI